MTPQEKAKELVNKFYQPLGYLNMAEIAGNMWEHGKKCAIICVDEIILEQCKSSELKNAVYQAERIDYWQDVLTELNKL
jgi:hypothetical protein